MREIIYSNDFDLAVDTVGGYSIVDDALEIVIDGLRLNPYGYPLFESDLISFRWIVVEATTTRPPLYFTFQILSNRNVELLHVEICEP